MEKDNYSIGIYGVQDVNSSDIEHVHDHALAFFNRGRLEKFIQLERVTRKKYDNRMPEFLYDILKAEKLSKIQNPDVIFTDNVIGRSFISRHGDIRFESPIATSLHDSMETGILRWFGKKLNGYILNHELAHIYSCLPFFGTFKDNSLLIHYDGGASCSNFSAWLYKNGRLLSIEANWELKKYTSLFNANALSFAIIGSKRSDQNSVPGKLMGLASWGKYRKEIEIWLNKNQFFENIWGKKTVFFNAVQRDFGITLTSFDQKHPFIQDVISTMHEIFENAFLNKLSVLQDSYNAKYLYYTGGSALNISLNSKIIDQGFFDDVFIPPCPNDSGLAIGASACLAAYKGHHIERHSPYLNNIGLSNVKKNHSVELIQKTAEIILQEKVVGTCIGAGEAGPRALGNRSLLGLPTAEMARYMSMEIKKREWYRPVAPIMLERNACHITGNEKMHHLSKYMLLQHYIPEKHRNGIEGIVHADGTSRIQVLFSRDDHSFIYDLLDYLDRQFDIKALINTSFNVQGEPMVHTAEDAINSAKSMKLGALILNDRLMIF